MRTIRVFGSVLYGADADGSDLDLLVEPTEHTPLLDIGAIQLKPEGIEVDVVTPRALPENGVPRCQPV